jgi:hypothetical protein
LPSSAEAPTKTLQVSRSATRKPSVPLLRNVWTANESVYVFLDREGKSVTFSLDGIEQRVDTKAPWDFNGGERKAIAFVNNLTAGSHTITAVLTRHNRRTVMYEATFIVAGDSTPPSLVSMTPAPGATNVSTVPFVSLTFSEAIQNKPGFGLIGIHETNRVCCVPSTEAIVNGNTIVAQVGSTPFALTPSTSYTVMFQGVVDLNGNELGPFETTFTTGPVATDITPPSVATISPADGATGVVRSLPFLEPIVRLEFSEAVQYGDASSITLAPVNGAPVPIQTIQCCTILSFAPVDPMEAFTTYVVTLTNFRDWAGNVMPPFTSTFTTGAV